MILLSLILASLCFLLIGLLPVIFFKRDGKLTPMWWATATPFFLTFLLMISAAQGVLPSALAVAGAGGAVAQALSCMLSALSILLIGSTLNTHKKRISLWHQKNDAPEHIVTTGPYAHIRHPFYSAFILALLAACAAAPGPATAALLIYGGLILNLTAAREERKLAGSAFGQEYVDYMRRAGRFIPKLGRKPL